MAFPFELFLYISPFLSSIWFPFPGCGSPFAWVRGIVFYCLEKTLEDGAFLLDMVFGFSFPKLGFY
jgi:hypothetical protein